MDLLVFVAGALLIALAVRWWRSEPPPVWMAVYGLLVVAFFAVPLATSRVQVPTDLPYRVLPWSDTLTAPLEVQNPLLPDLPLQMLPFHTLVRRRLLALEAPLWANELGTGQALLGNAQSSPFAPLHLMALPLPPLRGMTLAAAWQLYLALLLMHALALTLMPAPMLGPSPRAGIAQLGAALAAVSFAFSTFSVVWLYFPLGMTAVWLPGVVLGIVALARGERRAFPGLVVAAVGMALSGHPETLAHSAVLAAGLAAVLLIRGPRVGRWRFALRAVGAGLLAACLAAPALLPVLEVLPSSLRMARVPQGGKGLEPRAPEVRLAVPLVEPLIFGSPRDGDWSGPTNFNNDCSEYAGAAVVALAVAGALVLGGRVLALVLAGAAAFLAALGVSPFLDLFVALPGMGFAANSRLRLFWVLAVALAAGLSVPALVRRRAGPWVAAGSLIVVLGLVAWLRPPLDTASQHLWWGVTLAGLAAVLVTVAVPRWRPALAAVALLATAADLLSLGIRYNPILPPGRQLEAPAAVSRLEDLARVPAEDLAGVPAEDLAGPGAAGLPSPVRVIGEGWSLSPNLGVLYGLWDPRGHDPMRTFSTHWLLSRRLSRGQPGDQGQVRLVAPFDLPALRMLGVRYVLVGRRRRLPPPWERVFKDVGGAVWRLPDPLDLFFVPRRVEAADEAATARTVARNEEDFADLAVFETHPPDPARDVARIRARKRAQARGKPWPLVPPGPAARQEGRVWLRALQPNGFELVTRSREGALVASSVSAVPGWRVRIDGEPAPPPLRVNSAFLGFRVPAGMHRVELDYRPWGWTWGWAAFWLALAVTAALSLRSAGWRRWLSRKSAAPRPVAP